ncbi:MAG: VWA domain-containing protein [Gammaproteobacteria bacterium]
MKRIFACCCIALLGACAPPAARNTGVYLLLDTSGTYRSELRKAEDIILFTLSKLEPADSFAVARIDTGSFSEKDIIAKTTFDDRPSTANAQKRAFAQRVQGVITRSNASSHTDITGGLLQAVEFLNEKQPGRKTILIFSDLEQDLAAGYIRDIPIGLEGFEVVALNVVKLRSDNYDPREYMARLDSWKAQVEKGGGRWRVVNDLDRLDGLL